ncbi:MAG TPA: hypothetical protein VMZ31_01185 [Phycisphaerae bacterium]|nr:hypothetical protein [Phycisphaerae bacterium]
MSKRERILAVVVGAVAVVMIGWKLVDKLVIEPAERLDTRIQAAKRKLDNLGQLLAQKVHYVRQWDDLAARTLAVSDEAVVTGLDAKIKALLEKHKLQQVSVTPQGAGPLGRTKLRQVRFGVNAQGKLTDVVGLLYGFYRLPYLVRIRDLTLSPVGKSKGDQLKLTARIETLVLPSTKIVPDLQVAPADASEGDGPGRLTRGATLASFAGIARRNPFVPWEPPPPPPTKPREVVTKPPPRQPAEPAVRQDRDADKKVVKALLSYWDEDAGELVEEVVVAQTGSAPTRKRRRGSPEPEQGEEERIRVGDKLDGLTLVRIHWLGAVAEDEAGKKTYVYPLGMKLSQRQELANDTDEELLRAYEAVHDEQ